MRKLAFAICWRSASRPLLRHMPTFAIVKFNKQLLSHLD